MPDQEDKVGRLERLRERCLQDVTRLQERLRDEVDSGAANGEDLVDVSAQIYERSRIISLIDVQQAKLKALDHAIAAARRGTYGICEMCGEQIPEERLEIVPETTVCVRCASKMEQELRQHQYRSSGVGRQ